MYLSEIANNGCVWGRTLPQEEWIGVLAKTAALGHWQALCDVLNVVSSCEGPGPDTRTSLLCAVDSAGRTVAEIAAQNGHWLTAWFLVNKCGATCRDGGPRLTPALVAALERGACLAAEVQEAAAAMLKAKVESANTTANKRAASGGGCRVIHVDDDLPAEDSGDDSDSHVDRWSAYQPAWEDDEESAAIEGYLQQLNQTMSSWKALPAAQDVQMEHEPVLRNPVPEHAVQRFAMPPANHARRSSRRPQHAFRTEEID